MEPYKNWTKDDLFNHLVLQCEEYGFDEQELLNAVYDGKWNPIKDFNGCSVVQDPLHPFYPCFIHDWDWIVTGGGNETDLKFRRNLIIFGFPKWKANLYYAFIRLGWLFYYKWRKRQ